MGCRRFISPPLYLAAALSAAACQDSSGPLGLTLQDANLLAGRLEGIDRAVATEALRGLSGLATPMKQAGIDVHNMSTTQLGRTLEWSVIHAELIFTNRPGAPADAIRLILYKTDSTFRPAYPLVEVGYADMYPHNTFNGGGPDSMSLRFVVTGGNRVVADFTAHSHADPTCQCATVEGWTTDGTTRVTFTVPYNIPPLGDGNFPGDFSVASPGLTFQHVSTLPGPGRSTATANLFLKFGDDSITTLSGLLHAHAGRLEGETEIRIGGEHFAAVTRTAAGITTIGPDGRALTGPEVRAVTALFVVPADIAYYIEWPTFVVFFCGC
jgi:hypothetical protein